MSDQTAVDQIIAVLDEGLEGPAHKWSYYLDQDAGLRKTLAALPAEEASRNVGGSSIAAHVHHIVFSFRAFGTFIAGDRTQYDWNESWVVKEVDAAAWDALRSELETQFQALRDTIRQHASDGALPLGASMGAAAHLAYHVGAIRQKLTQVRASA